MKLDLLTLSISICLSSQLPKSLRRPHSLKDAGIRLKSSQILCAIEILRMPIITLLRDDLYERLGRSYSQEKFEDLCFDFGIELDDVTSEKERVRKEQGEEAAMTLELSEDVEYKIEIPANRYDLLCLEGLARALRVFLKLDPSPQYRLTSPVHPQRIVVEASTEQIRPFCVAAVLRNVSFDETCYKSFIQLQEKLHQNICRERTLVAIGTHDLDTVKGPFRYRAISPELISFVPLKETREFDAAALFKYYAEEKEQSPLKKYLHIIEHSPVFPVIYDSNDVVLSLPPIINGEHSKISVNTKNVLIECTATDKTKALITLNTVCAMFSEYSKEKFTTEPVEIFYESSKTLQRTPDFSQNSFTASLDYFNKSIGIDIDLDTAQDLLHRMQLDTEVIDRSAGELKVTAPIIRSDILHKCDIMEDVAIAYGFNNIIKTLPKSATFGRQQPLNQLSDLIREGVAQAGFTEALTFALESRQDNFLNMRLDPTETASAVTLGPLRKTAALEIVRTSLIPGLLKTLCHNRSRMPLPMKIFECSDVCILDDSTDVGSRNERRIAALYGGKTSGFENTHGLLDRIMQLIGVEFDPEGEVGGYRLDRCEHPSLMNELGANILLGRQRIGMIGVVHPEVLSNFGISDPCSVFEINLEVFL